MNWRDIGDMTEDQFVAELARSPLASESRAIYADVRPHSILYRAILWHEGHDGTLGVAAAGINNPTGMRPRSDRRYPDSSVYTNANGQYLKYASFESAAEEWKERVTDPTYAYARTRTIGEFVHTYAPSSDGNDEAEYVAVIEQFVRKFGGSNPTTPTNDTITFGRVPKPTMIEMIVQKPVEGRGFDRVAPRKIVGTCNHRTEGRDTPEAIYRLFSTGGERQYDALTDYAIGTDGRIGHLNDEYGTRAGWANGGSDGLEGDGPNFVKTFGVVGINSRLVSVEHCGLGGDPFTPPQFDSSAKLNAWVFDKARVPWNTFPIHPTYGVVTQLEHWEFATKGCPGAVFRSRTNELHEAIRGHLKAAQLGGPIEPTPPVDPVDPGHGRYPPGVDEGLATALYGTMTKRRVNGSTTTLKFNSKSVICSAWLARGRDDGAFPQADVWLQYEDTPGNVREYAVFRNGWVLWRENVREGWKWM